MRGILGVGSRTYPETSRRSGEQYFDGINLESKRKINFSSIEVYLQAEPEEGHPESENLLEKNKRAIRAEMQEKTIEAIRRASEIPGIEEVRVELNYRGEEEGRYTVRDEGGIPENAEPGDYEIKKKLS